MENSNNKNNKSKKAGVIALVLTPLALVGATTAVVLAKQPQTEAVEPAKAITAPSEITKSTSPGSQSMETPGLVVESEANVDFGTLNLHTTERHGQKFYTESSGDNYRVFLYIDTVSLYLKADTGFPILETTATTEEIGGAEFSGPTQTKINEIIDLFHGLFEADKVYSLARGEDSKIFGYVVKKANGNLKFKTTHSGSTSATTLTETRRSVTGRIAWSGNYQQDKKVRLKKFRKRRINIRNQVAHPTFVYSVNIRGTTYHLELVDEGYRIFIYKDGLKYLNHKTGAIIADGLDQFFKEGSVYEMYQVAKKYRAQLVE